MTPEQIRAFKLTAGFDARNFYDGCAGSLGRAKVLLTPRPNEQEGNADNGDGDMNNVSEADVVATLPNRGFPTVAAAVGFAQSYGSLMCDVRRWLGGSDGGVRVVILVKLYEVQVDLRPFVHDGNRGDLIFGSRFGPVFYKGERIVGSITGRLEVWRSDPETFHPVLRRRKVISPQSRVDGDPLCSTNILQMILPMPRVRIGAENERIRASKDRFTLTMLDIFGSADRVPQQCRPTERVSFPLEGLRREIAIAVRTLVAHRLDEIQCQREMLVDDDEWTE